MTNKNIQGGLALLCMTAFGVVFVVWFVVKADPQLRDAILGVFDSVAFLILAQPGVFLLAYMSKTAFDETQRPRIRKESAALASIGALWIVGMFFLEPYLPDGGGLGGFMNMVTSAAEAAETTL